MITQVNQIAQLVTLNERTSSIQDKQLNIMESGVRITNKPKLGIELREISSDYLAGQFINKGGDIFNFKIIDFNGVKIDIGTLSQNKTIVADAYYDVRFTNLKKEAHRVKLKFEDNLGNKYTQVLFFFKHDDSYDVQLEPLMDSK